MARLGDLFLHIRNGANIKQGLDSTGYPITRIETISNRIVDRTKLGYAGVTDLGKYSDYVLQDGDILMSHINSETHLGKVALYEKENDVEQTMGLPVLCRIPILKYLFSTVTSIKERTYIIVTAEAELVHPDSSGLKPVSESTQIKRRIENPFKSEEGAE